MSDATEGEPAPTPHTFGTCCSELQGALKGEEFEPLVTVGKDGILYLTVGLIDLEDNREDPALVDHPIFFCPFCGAKLQSPDDVKSKIGGAVEGAAD
jgi:hypothetical protein